MPSPRPIRPSGHRGNYRRVASLPVDAAAEPDPVMPAAPPRPASRATTGRSADHALSRDALDNLQFIRQTLERAGPFTAVPGKAQIVIGATALLAALLAAQAPTVELWIAIWMGEAVLSGMIGVWAIGRKARAKGLSLLAYPNRRFAFSFSPPMAAGALLTLALYLHGAASLLPGMWLLLFGAGVTAGGALSVRIIPVMGVSFLGVGAAALFAPAAWGNLFMALGFGVLLIAFGIVIAWKYGG